MPCYHPKKGFLIGTTAAGKPKYKITDFGVDHIEMTDSGWESSSINMESARARYSVRDWIQIPCGKCLGCRLEYARQWTTRLMCEKELWRDDQCWFLTLTYDDEHLPLVPGADHLGEACLWPTLEPRDMTLFWKRLRKHFSGFTIKYFQASEYGSRTARPHYHAIVFGLPLSEKDLIPYGSGMGNITYKCPMLDKIWSKGFVVVGSVTNESCGYVARYCLKKIYDSVTDDYSNRVHEFTRMSTNPGIGKNWFLQNLDALDTASFCLDGAPGQKFYLPRYYLKCLESIDSERLYHIKEQRSEVSKLKYENMIKDGRPYLAQLRSMELEKNAKIACLRRKL